MPQLRVSIASRFDRFANLEQFDEAFHQALYNAYGSFAP